MTSYDRSSFARIILHHYNVGSPKRQAALAIAKR
jgi:hypothetical protein